MACTRYPDYSRYPQHRDSCDTRADGSDVVPIIECGRRQQNGIALGRARRVPSPDGKTPLAIAFIGQDESGATGVYMPDFVPGPRYLRHAQAAAAFRSDRSAGDTGRFP